MVNKDELKGIEGWLALFVVTLVLSILRNAASQASDMTMRGFQNLFIVVEALFTLYTLALLRKHKERGVTCARIILWVHVILGGLTLIGGNIQAGLQGLVYGMVWLLYLAKSVRVRNTFYAPASTACPSCGNETIPDKFCTSCGGSLVKGAAAGK